MFKDKSTKRLILSILLYPLIILTLVVSIKFFGVKNTPKATLDNIIFYSTHKDREIIYELKDYLKPYNDKFIKLLDYTSNRNIDIIVDRTFKDYVNNVFSVQPRWPESTSIFITSELNNIHILSPNNKTEEYYNMDYIKTRTKISLCKYYFNNVNLFYERLPLWLTDGYAIYLSLDEKELDKINTIIKDNDIPDMDIMNMDQNRSMLYSINTDHYTLNNGFEFSYLFIKFFIDKYGEKTILEWTKDKTFQFEDTGYESYENLYEDLEEYRKKNF